MSSLEQVKDALAPALAEVLAIGEASFKRLRDDIEGILGGNKKRPRAAIKTFLENFALCSVAAQRALLTGQTEKGERMLRSMAGTLSTYQVLATSKAINEAYAAWRKILMVAAAVVKEVGPLAVGAIAGPAAGAVAKAFASKVDGDGGTTPSSKSPPAESPPAESPPASDEKNDKTSEPEDPKVALKAAVTSAKKTFVDAENNLKAAIPGNDKKRISTAKGKVTKAQKAWDLAKENLANAANA